MGTNAAALMESLQPPTQAFIAGSRTDAASGEILPGAAA